VRPHVPFVAPESCFTPYPDEEMEVPPVVVGDNVPEQALARQNMKLWKMSEEQKRKTLSGYMASVNFMDRQVGRLMQALESLGLRENTLVVFISDHGYNLGEHDCWSKSQLWEGSLRVPMIISHPRYSGQHGLSTTELAELIDLYPTLAEFCGLNEDQPDILQGHSLAPLIMGKGKGSERNVAYSTLHHGKSSSIRTERWRYNRWGEEALVSNEELYDHKEDPEENRNLVTDGRYKEVLREMRLQFDRARARARNTPRQL